MTKKLAGRSKKNAAWAANVGNEAGQVLMCVMTDCEGEGLEKMAHGLVKRYADADQTPPILLYIDRDCCSDSGCPKVKTMFAPWDIKVRLDIWHFMRRFAVGLTSEMHPLAGTFLQRLSSCIFEWDANDIQRLRTAKCKELQDTGHHHPTSQEVDAALTRKEMARHCRRRTRGIEATASSIHSLIGNMKDMSDLLGTKLMNYDRMCAIWNVQKKHISCIQAAIQLYTKTGHLMKGGIDLPVYRCARGSTSLESFHLHLNRFIPGK